MIDNIYNDTLHVKMQISTFGDIAATEKDNSFICSFVIGIEQITFKNKDLNNLTENE